MELNEFEKSDKLLRAQKRVKKLKGFYIHLIVYLLVNIFISTTTVIARMNGGETFNEAFFNFASFSTAIFWGIGLAFHGAKVFNYNPFFSRDWEERQIRKYVDKDKKEEDKFR
ncbi:2TM domain-containing protein [Maribacter sp. ACAM166]|uniref:2TM domain-containing protein n=1 Tax=Maribacter sp. ACAM166 TaxID=2508996 RepID=UPI0010FCF7D0|nr:2TM domain-containing protein [Maribacter sp. ACAM166]TLP71251.1 2TM domain-containing protein [Maribacter sp. ACAM166]